MSERNGRSGPRPAASARVVIVTPFWGDDENEATVATRLIAGALARRADVEVVHLAPPPATAGVVADSVFRVHTMPLLGARPLRRSMLRAALGTHDGGEHLPGAALDLLQRYQGEAEGVPELVTSLEPGAVLLVGDHQPYDLSFLAERGRSGRPRVVVVPLVDSAPRLASPGRQALLACADAIGVAHDGERRAVLEACPDRTPDEVVPLDLAFSINRSATIARLFGVRFFGRYVLLLRSFPAGAPRFERSVTHEVVRGVLGGISVAEVDNEHWRISDDENTLALPVNPTRVNLWRLMAHALFTIDVRPPGPIGREAIESMLLGTPVLAYEPSAAMEHVAAADGGLWYRDPGELFDAARALMSRPLRVRLAAQASQYAGAHHGQMDDFVDRMAAFVLGSTATSSP